MYQLVIVLVALLATASEAVHSSPYGGKTVEDCVYEGWKFADEEYLESFWQCGISGPDVDGNYQFILLPLVCALGTRVGYSFVEGEHNPCTHNFNKKAGFDYERRKPAADVKPACFDELDCKNGGTAAWQSDHCWCLCTAEYQGDYDCSVPTRVIDALPPGSSICVDGEPKEDWCQKEDGGCLNGGLCYNQCDSFWCDCPRRDSITYIGKRCETEMVNES